MNYTDIIKLRKPEGGEYYDVENFNKNSDLLDAAVNSKADKPRSATAGNFPMLDAGGNLGDSGKSASSFAAANHGHDAAYAPIAHVSDAAIHVDKAEKAVIAAVSDKADRVYVDSALSTKANQKWVESAMVTKLPLAGGTMTGSMQFNPANNGRAELFKNASALADYGTALEDISADGARMSLTLRALSHTAALSDEHGNSYKVATATPTVTQLTPLNGLAVTGNNICKLSDCGAAKVINAELQFSTNIPDGAVIMYTGVLGIHTPIICSVFDQYDGTFLGQKVAWHYVDGRVAMFGGSLSYNPAYGPYNILQISTVIGG